MLPADHCGEKKLIHHVTAPIPDELFSCVDNLI